MAKIYAPNTVNTTKALLFIQAYRPDIFNVDFLKSNKKLIKQLASAYDNSLSFTRFQPESQKITKAKESLLHEKPITMDKLKKRCTLEFKRYIKSRGSLSVDGVFDPSIITKLFRNDALTMQKVNLAKKLIQDIKDARTPEDIKSAINNPAIVSPVKADDLLSRINKCLFVLDSVSEFNLQPRAMDNYV